MLEYGLWQVFNQLTDEMVSFEVSVLAEFKNKESYQKFFSHIIICFSYTLCCRARVGRWNGLQRQLKELKDAFFPLDYFCALCIVSALLFVFFSSSRVFLEVFSPGCAGHTP